MLSIHERDFDPADRSTAGNWEGDLIIGKGQRSAIGTLVERKSRYVKLLHLGWRDSTSLHQAIVNSMNPLPPHLRLSLTWDQGTEMAQHQEIRRDTHMKVYFCDPASPWQRPSNENTNGLLEWSPKVGLGKRTLTDGNFLCPVLVRAWVAKSFLDSGGVPPLEVAVES